MRTCERTTSFGASSRSIADDSQVNSDGGEPASASTRFSFQSQSTKSNSPNAEHSHDSKPFPTSADSSRSSVPRVRVSPRVNSNAHNTTSSASVAKLSRTQ